mgnify:CR=1 FL=1
MRLVRKQYGVVHRGCGHACATSPSRHHAEVLRGILSRGGCHQWRVLAYRDSEAFTAAVEVIVENPQGCEVCRVDQDRVLALIAASGLVQVQES